MSRGTKAGAFMLLVMFILLAMNAREPFSLVPHETLGCITDTECQSTDNMEI